MRGNLENLQNKRILAQLLGSTLNELKSFARRPEKYYRLRNVGKKKPRLAEVPVEKLKFVQSNIKRRLDEFESPAYRHCGIKGKSYKTNAEAHLGAQSFGSMDIKSYYKNSKREHVFRFFHYKLKIAEDVAWLLTDLVTYKGFIPTGSPSSQAVAFWSHANTFDKVNAFVRAKGKNFGLYVDDIGISSGQSKVQKDIHLKIGNILKNDGLKLKRSKVKYSKRSGSPFEITGAITHSSGEVKAPNRLKKRLFDELDSVNRNINLLEEKSFRSLIGVLRSIRMLEPNAFPALHGQFKLREKELNRRLSQKRKSKISLEKSNLKRL